MSQYRRRLIKGKLEGGTDQLPYDAELEYLETTGTQHIKLDISPDITTDACEIYFQQTTNVTQGRFFSGGSIVFYVNGSNNFAVGLYSGSWTWQSVYATNVGTVKRKWKVDYPTKKVYIDDYNVYNYTKTLTNITSSVVYVFWDGSTANRHIKGKLFHVKYWKNGELIRDMIPVRKGQVGYMYDKINRKFYGNDGTGEFGLGRDVYTKLSAYTRPDYIMGEGVVFDTRFVPNGNTRTILDMWSREIPYINKSYCQVFGARQGYQSSDYTFDLTTFDSSSTYYQARDVYGNNSKWSDYQYYTIKRMVVDKDKGNISATSVYDDSIQYSLTRATQTFNSKYPMYLGTWNSNNTAYPAGGVHASFFSFKIYDNDTLVRDYIPVIHPDDGTCGFFDNVQKKFFETDYASKPFRPGYVKTTSSGYKYIFYNNGVSNTLTYTCNNSDLISSLIPIKTRRIKIKRDPNYTTKVIEYGARSIIKKGNETIISNESDGDIIEVGPDCNMIALLIEGATINYIPDVDVIDIGETNYLALTALEDGTFTFTIGSAVTTTQLNYVEYSTDGGTTWVKTTNVNNTTKTITTPTITTGNKVLWRGIGQRTCNSTSNATQRSVFSSTGKFDVSGNILSLLFGEDFADKDCTDNTDAYAFGDLFCASKLVHAHELCLSIWYLRTYAYWGMFSYCTYLVSTPKLHSLKLTGHCYQAMFRGCTSLTSIPYLPAKILNTYSYHYMFEGCTSLTSTGTVQPTLVEDFSYSHSYMFANCTSLQDASELNLTLFLTYAYQYMFANCTSLTVPPIMGNGERGTYCCQYMFNNCTSLVNAPTLGGTTLAQYCYFHMFDGCTSIVTAPALPATTLSARCYDSMFKNCTSLINAPVLPSNSIPDYAYSSMFEGCTSLVTAPTLNAYSINTYGYNRMFAFCTSLVNVQDILPSVYNGTYAYKCMFYGCTSLVKAPKLPRVLLYTGLYQYMFAGCTSLNYIDCMAIDMTATNSILEWTAAIQDGSVDNTQSGVASTGTFIQRADATWDSGVSGIPQGWTVKYLNPENGKYYNDSACTSEWQDSPYPSNMTKISYLQNNGNKARIRTGLFNFITKYEVKFNYTTWKSGAPVLDNYNSANHNRMGIVMPSSNNGNLSVYFDTKSNGGATTVAAASGTDHVITVEKAVSVTVDEVEKAITNTTSGTANTNSIALFAANTTNSTLYATGMKIYYFKAWNNGLLIRHLIPVRIGDSEGAMYDISNGQLLTNPYEAAFTLGPDIT